MQGFLWPEGRDEKEAKMKGLTEKLTRREERNGVLIFSASAFRIGGAPVVTAAL